MCQASRENTLWFVLREGRAKACQRDSRKGTCSNETIRTHEEFLSCISLCIHLNGVSHMRVALVCVLMCGVSAHVCVWLQRVQECVWWPVSLLSAYALETGSHTEPETHHFSDATWLANFHLSLLSAAGITGMWGHAELSHGCWGSKFGSLWPHSKHSYTQSCLPTPFVAFLK